MTTEQSIPDTPENWENGKLGQSEEHARVAPDQSADIDEALGLYRLENFRIPKDEAETLVEMYRKAYPESQASTDVVIKAYIRHLVTQAVNNYKNK